MLKHRTLLFSVILVLAVFLSGCAGSVSGVARSVVPVDDMLVESALQYRNGRDLGDVYTVSLTVPEDWVGVFELRNDGDTLYFDFIRENGVGAPIFFIEALSEQQYWQQIGSYPGDYTNLDNRNDTYFIYHLPKDPHYSGLPADDFADFAELVPDIVSTFDAVRVSEFY